MSGGVEEWTPVCDYVDIGIEARSQCLERFDRLREAWSRPFDPEPADADLMRPAQPAERVTTTFCGT